MRSTNGHSRIILLSSRREKPLLLLTINSATRRPHCCRFRHPATANPRPQVPPPRKSQNPPQPPTPNPGLKYHRNSKYHKRVPSDGVVVSDAADRSVIIGESGVSYLLPGAPFEFQFSYSETPKAKPIAIREPAFLPFAPPTMPRPWTGKAPLKSKKKKIPLFDSFNPPPPGTKGVKRVEMPGPFPMGQFPKEGKTREEILGEPLKKWEVQMLVQPMISYNRQVNLGRDGLTHNMLELVHSHWKRSRICKIRCLGVPTVDMDNVCHHIEEKTGGKIIHRAGGVVYLFRGRNYNYRTRPQYPVMLWKPATPVYPKLIEDAPGGLTKAEADELRKKGKSLLPICKLGESTNVVRTFLHHNRPRRGKMWKKGVQSLAMMNLFLVEDGASFNGSVASLSWMSEQQETKPEMEWSFDEVLEKQETKADPDK
ncbi:hypothetical protein ACSQ67_005968 [Phaseolus vulgaris]